VPEQNFWTLWCKGRLTEAHTPTIRLGATPSRLTSAHHHYPPFFTGQMPFLLLSDQMPFLLPNQQCQSTEGNKERKVCGTQKNLETGKWQKLVRAGSHTPASQQIREEKELQPILQKI